MLNTPSLVGFSKILQILGLLKQWKPLLKIDKNATYNVTVTITKWYFLIVFWWKLK